MLKFTGTEGLIYRNKYLVISDLHIGIEIELAKKGIYVSSQLSKILDKIEKLKNKYDVKYLIINGDVKHNIPDTKISEISDLVEFFHTISDWFKKIYVLKGNHDGDIELFIPKIPNIKILKELYDKKNRVSFLHGNRKSSFDADLYVIGHHHFVKTIVSKIGESFYEKVFVLGYTYDSREVLILPAFSSLVGYWEIGRFHGPIAKKIVDFEVYTLDGILIDIRKNEIT